MAGFPAAHGLGEADGPGEAVADPQRGASEASRLLVAVATPPRAVATAAALLVPGWAVKVEIAVLSVSSADFTALVCV